MSNKIYTMENNIVTIDFDFDTCEGDRSSFDTIDLDTTDFEPRNTIVKVRENVGVFLGKTCTMALYNDGVIRIFYEGNLYVFSDYRNYESNVPLAEIFENNGITVAWRDEHLALYIDSRYGGVTSANFTWHIAEC